MPSSRATERWVTAGSRSTASSNASTISSLGKSRLAPAVSKFPIPYHAEVRVHALNAQTRAFLLRSVRERQAEQGRRYLYTAMLSKTAAWAQKQGLRLYDTAIRQIPDEPVCPQGGTLAVRMPATVDE